MERIKTTEIPDRYTQLDNCLLKVKEAIGCYTKYINSEELCLKRLIRDGLIQNYEFTVELFWKFLHIFVRSQDLTIDSHSAIATLRGAETFRIISEEEYNQLTQVIRDRNETSHAYFEALAIEIVERIPAHYHVMKKILDRIKIEP